MLQRGQVLTVGTRDVDMGLGRGRRLGQKDHSWAGPSKIQKMHYSTPAYQSMSLQPCLPTSVGSLEVASRAGRDQKLVSQEEGGPRFEHRTLSLQPKVLNHCTQHCPHLEHSKFTGSCEAHCTCYEKALICPPLSLFKYRDGQLKFIRYIQRISSHESGEKGKQITPGN